MNPPANSTSKHLRLALDGSQEDLEWVVRRFSPLLLAKAAESMGSHLSRVYDPGDIVGHVWLVILPKLPDIIARDGRFTPSFVKFLSTILINYVNKLLRDEFKKLNGVELDDPETNVPVNELPSDTLGVVSRIVEEEKHGGILAAIDSLAPEDRQIILLRCIDRLGNSEVAQMLEITQQLAATRFHRAKQKLLGQLQGSVFDELL